MEKDYRLFVKNLPLNINDDGVKEIFDKFVTIKKIDLKEKKDLNNKINKFAFINVSATDKKLHDCFGKVNGERFDGFEISVELAKESFLDRLKREREESNQKKEAPKDFANSFALENLTSTNANHKKFDDVDFSSKEFEIEKVKKKRKSSINETDTVKVEPVQSFEDIEYKTKDFEEPYDSFKVEKKKYVNNFEADDTEVYNEYRNKKVKKAHEFNNYKPIKHSVPDKPVSKSEEKRRISLKEKKKVFKAQGQVIRNALKSVDDAKLNKKIVFDDDTDFDNLKVATQKSSKQNNPLFDNENEEEEENYEWNEEELEAKASTKQKLLKMQTSIGNDERFVLDDRFVDDDDDEESVKKTNNSEQNNDSEFDEKKWMMKIYEQVSGKPQTTPTPTSSDVIPQKKKMIRYDPTANDHEKYEVTVEKPKQEKRKKKKKKDVEEEVKEVAPLPTSSEIYYDVATNFADSFKPSNGGFSLLKSCGRDEVSDKRQTGPVKEVENNGSGFSFNFTGRNPFRHDSDNEGGDDVGENDYSFKLNANANTAAEDDDKLFTPLGDSRIEELNKFFNTPSIVDEEAFKRRRRELKKIVRTKIRNNVKKATPWNKKKVRREKKKQR